MEKVKVFYYKLGGKYKESMHLFCSAFFCHYRDHHQSYGENAALLQECHYAHCSTSIFSMRSEKWYGILEKFKFNKINFQCLLTGALESQILSST